MVFKACMKISKSGPSESMRLFPAIPFAMTVTMSLVEVSPSTLTMLKVFAISVERAFLSIFGEMAASVVMNTSIVAIFG